MSSLLDIRPEKVRAKKLVFPRNAGATEYDSVSGDAQSYSDEKKKQGLRPVVDGRIE
jgi:hypothetical protein